MDENKKMYAEFAITSVCRQDLLSVGFTKEQALAVDDSDMERIASKMADAYCDSGFWIDLPIIVGNVVTK